MARPLVLIGAILGGLTLVFAAGFFLFARTVAHYGPVPVKRAEAIVVLTGGELRLVAAAKLLTEGRGARLLISGVNPQTPPESLQRVSGLPPKLFACCVDIDYALTTADNAEQIRAWAEAKGFKRLIVVTSSYHMPRSLAELRRRMPNAALVPYAVVPHSLRPERWWADPYTARVLLWEYVKFLPSAARYGIARLLSWDGKALAKAEGQRASHL